MRPTRPLPVLLVALLFVVAGCLGSPGGAVRDTTDGSPTPSGDRTPGSDGEPIAHETYAFDHAGVDEPAIEGGIRYPRDGQAPTQLYATIVTTDAETERFHRDVLDEGAERFVDATDLDRSYLVVFQAYPASSRPDYRVVAARRSGEDLRLRVNDSSEVRTTDVTVETLLVRVERDGRDPPRSVTVTTEAGVSVTSGAGVRTVTPSPTPTPDDVSLPYASSDASENVVEPVDLRVVNHGNATNGYHLRLGATETPACRSATPPCGMPSREVTVLGRTGKLPPGTSTTIEDVVAKRGTYALAVEADVPAGDGGRRTVSTSADWVVDAAGDDATVVVTDDGVHVDFAGGEG